MKEQELRDALSNAVGDCQLSEYQKRLILMKMKGEEPVKKKLTVSVVLVMAIMMLTLGVAAAIMHSTIVDQLFGSAENAPEEVMERIQTPQQATHSPLGTLSLDEWFYDGQSLHTAFSIANSGEESLFYTLDGIHLNGEHVTYNHNRTEGAGDSGFLLGGAVDDVNMPASVSLYNQGDGLYAFNENGKYAGTVSIPEGASTLKISVAVWRPLNNVELVDYNQYEGKNINETKDHLTVDKNGFSQLWLFRNENINYNASQSGAQIYKDTYQKLGWMELLGILEVETDVVLNKDQAVCAVPESMEYEMADCKLVLEQFHLSHAGGKMEAQLYGEPEIIESLLNPHGFRLVDLKNEKVLDAGCYWYELTEVKKGFHIDMTFAPLSGDLPEEIYFVPALGYNGIFDQNVPYYDPSIDKPANVIEGWECDLSRAVKIPLRIIP